jgi:mannose-6-phosphate isomerase-like protein (cupin superfamily)
VIVIDTSATIDRRTAHYFEHLRVPDLSLGTYLIPAGGADPQSPHTEDEVYVVQSGRARLWTPDLTVDVGPGAVLFVPAHEDHRFVDVEEDLTVLVLFGPAEGARDGSGLCPDTAGHPPESPVRGV